MGFRTRQKLFNYPSGTVSLPQSKVNDDGSISIELVPCHIADLPDPENFRLKNLLAAGVPIDEVNTKVLSSASLSLDVASKLSKKPVEKPAEKPAEKSAEKPAEKPAENSNPNTNN